MKKAASNSHVAPQWLNATRKWVAAALTLAAAASSNKVAANPAPKWPSAANAATAVEIVVDEVAVAATKAVPQTRRTARDIQISQQLICRSALESLRNVVGNRHYTP